MPHLMLRTILSVILTILPVLIYTWMKYFLLGVDQLDESRRIEIVEEIGRELILLTFGMSAGILVAAGDHPGTYLLAIVSLIITLSVGLSYDTGRIIFVTYYFPFTVDFGHWMLNSVSWYSGESNPFQFRSRTPYTDASAAMMAISCFFLTSFTFLKAKVML